jgi:hypothetical protein
MDPSSDKKFPSLMTKIPDEKLPNVFSEVSSDDTFLGFTSGSSVQETKNKVVKNRIYNGNELNKYLA